jgi:hypothetical protein
MYPFVCGPQLQMDKTTCQQNKGKWFEIIFVLFLPKAWHTNTINSELFCYNRTGIAKEIHFLQHGTLFPECVCPCFSGKRSTGFFNPVTLNKRNNVAAFLSVCVLVCFLFSALLNRL